jgi:hypothetical protein
MTLRRPYFLSSTSNSTNSTAGKYPLLQVDADSLQDLIALPFWPLFLRPLGSIPHPRCSNNADSSQDVFTLYLPTKLHEAPDRPPPIELHEAPRPTVNDRPSSPERALGAAHLRHWGGYPYTGLRLGPEKTGLPNKVSY